MFGKRKIKDVYAYEAIDSRGYPTVACKVVLWNGAVGKSMVPSGASTGIKEALELRDGDKRRFNGKGVLKAVDNINRIIRPHLIGKNATKQSYIDSFMMKIDGTETKSVLGANAILAVSLAVCKAAANSYKIPLYKYIRKNLCHISSDAYKMPVPMLNVINGGAHADNTIDFQEFMFMPIGAKKIKQAVQIASECFQSLQTLLKARGLNTNKGDEGGFAPNLKNAEEALDIMVEAIKNAHYNPTTNEGGVAIALDVAASELYEEKTKTYCFKKALAAKILNETDAHKTTEQMIEYLNHLSKKYPIISIEDGLDENDWEGFNKLKQTIGTKVQIVGDDLFCTNPKYIKIGIEKDAASAVLIKPNQIGTLSETIQSIQLALNNNWCAVISHRSGETEDTTIADLAVALDAGQIKTGSMSRSERIAKYNRLIEIEDELGIHAYYDGLKSFKHIIKPANVNKPSIATIKPTINNEQIK